MIVIQIGIYRIEQIREGKRADLFPCADDIGAIVSIHIKMAAPVTKRGG